MIGERPMIDPFAVLAEARAKSSRANFRSESTERCESENEAPSRGYANFRDSRNFRNTTESRDTPDPCLRDKNASAKAAKVGDTSRPLLKKERNNFSSLISGLATLEPEADPTRSPPLAKVANDAANHCSERLFAQTDLLRKSGEICVSAARIARTWLDAFERLSSQREPCPGFRAGDWPKVYRAAVAFLEDFGEQASALGWATLDLFGVHPDVGMVRVDCAGALMVSGGARVVALTADTIRYVDGLTYRRTALGPAVAVWDFGSPSPRSFTRAA